ncbi:nucleoside deaminase [Bradyrhizobium cenepequi]
MTDSGARDRLMMMRCIDLSRASGQAGEYPYGAIICRNETIVAESINRVTHDGDVTRHAELVTISRAQKVLGTASLDDCEMYANAEPCALCSYAIRESRIRRVVYALRSPHMGGMSKWNVLNDNDLFMAMPEVFAPPPEIIAGFMADEAMATLVKWNPLITGIVRQRGLFGAAPRVLATYNHAQGTPHLNYRLLRFLRRYVFDYFGRR